MATTTTQLTSTTTQQVLTSTTTTQQFGQIPSPHCDLNLGASVAALAVDDPVMVCIFLSTSPPKKMIFKLIVEEYASLKLAGSKDLARGGVISNGRMITKNNASTPTDDIHTWIARSDAAVAWPLNCNSDDDMNARGAYVSCPQIFASGSHVAHVLSLVINLRDGLISSFAWDNGCAACGPQRCMKSAVSLDRNMIPGAEKFGRGSCGRTYVQCEDPKACDLQILVTWAGTDKEGRHLQSAGRRLSRFSGSTIGSLYETMDYNMR